MTDAPSPVSWTEDGLPRSRLYDDVYFSSQDGLAESRAVYLAGCGLPEAWAGRRHYTVAELGFGSGLNIAALLMMWREHGPPDGRLHIFSVEAHPMSQADARRALDRWPEIAPAAEALVNAWPAPSRGFHRLDLPAFRATLDLAILEVGEALSQWRGPADAWLLDGFAPSANPAMWRQEVLDLVAARSAPGARAATFTVAGAVRRGLAQAGFEIAKRPGFGRKSERLEAVYPGVQTDPPATGSVAVIGAGIAGCAMARALADQNHAVLLIDGEGLGAGASGNPAALVTPRLDAGLGPVARLAAQAFDHATRLYETWPQAIIARGALQLSVSDKDPDRYARIAASGLFAPGSLSVLDAAAASARLDEPTPGALAMEQAMVIEPTCLLERLIDNPAITRLSRRIAQLMPVPGGWRLQDDAGATLAEVATVIVASGWASETLIPNLGLRPVRGQASWTREPFPAGPAAAFGGYAIPTREGLLFGATHDRERRDRAVEPGDDIRNLAALAKGLPQLAQRLAGRAFAGRAGIRAATADHLPLSGPLGEAPGLWILSGLGGRGFSLAPLLAADLAARVAGVTSPLPVDLAALVDPGRFERRAALRRPSSGAT